MSKAKEPQRGRPRTRKASVAVTLRLAPVVAKALKARAALFNLSQKDTGERMIEDALASEWTPEENMKRRAQAAGATA